MIRHELYSPYERVWHWLQAAAILLLLATGLVVHWPDLFGGTGFAAAVRLHNALGFLLIGNAALGAFWYMTTGTIRQYLPEPREFLSLSVRQASYYLRGMFRGEPHPLEKSAARRLNPLQQVTYLVILNVLLPLQMTTGILIWGAERWPSVAGDLPFLTMIHTLGAWLFASFVLMHVYLITTGRTPLSNLMAMVLGYEGLPEEHLGSERAATERAMASTVEPAGSDGQSLNETVGSTSPIAAAGFQDTDSR